MNIATYNINGINGRPENLLGWLEEAAPLQAPTLKTSPDLPPQLLISPKKQNLIPASEITLITNQIIKPIICFPDPPKQPQQTFPPRAPPPFPDQEPKRNNEKQ